MNSGALGAVNVADKDGNGAILGVVGKKIKNNELYNKYILTNGHIYDIIYLLRTKTHH